LSGVNTSAISLTNCADLWSDGATAVPPSPGTIAPASDIEQGEGIVIFSTVIVIK
jgi:hypothetical protein